MDGTAFERLVATPSRVKDEPRRTMLTTARGEFAGAVECHQAGDLEAAARLYESVLEREPAHAQALHLLGLLRLQQGRAWVAVQFIGRAVRLRPDAAAFRATLAEAHRAQGELELAVECGRAAIELGLHDPAVHNGVGLALLSLGRSSEAVDAFLAGLKLKPDDAMLHTNLGSALVAVGARQSAVDHLRKAVAIDPKLASAHSNLGQLLLDLDRLDEALVHCREAVALQPGMGEAHNSLGNVQRAQKRYAEARWCYTEAMRLRPTMAQPHASMGLTLQQEERWDEAILWFRRATELEPSSTGFLALFAEALVEREEFAEAVTCYEKMLAIDPGSAVAHNALGWLLQEQGRLEQAAEHLMSALHEQPDLAIAHVNLGGVFEKLGDFATAETSFRMAIRDKEAKGPALARLAMLLRGALPAADRQDVEQYLVQSDAEDPARVNVLFGLAGVCDAQNRHAEAALWARQAHSLSQSRLERRKLAYKPADHESFISALIEAFDPAFFRRLAGAGSDSRRPVFIVGLPRSGTTLIEQILTCHSQYHGAGELALVRQDFSAIPELLNRAVSPVACIADLDAALVSRLAEIHLERLRQLDDGRLARIGDKMPENYVHLGLIAAMFPNAAIIHCRRDRFDVAVSCFLTGFQTVRWNHTTLHLAARIGQYERLMSHWRAVLPVTIHEVAYEDIVADLEGTARRLVTACGLDWEPACLDFHKNPRPVRTASFNQVRQPVYQSSVGRWKNYQSELADLLAAVAAATKGDI
jgi:tetratricopeptide (TPR) repeat protein